MRTRRIIIITAMLAAFAGSSMTAQESDYDLTQYYLQNADFTANIDYSKTSTEGDVKGSTASTPKGWTMDASSKTTLAVVATFEYGTPVTFLGKSIPATGPDGTANGACLTLSAAFGNNVTFYQSMKIPAGNYKIVITYYNCNDAADGIKSNMSGWYVSDNDKVLSETIAFGTNEWRTDVIPFTLTEPTAGNLRLGITCSGAVAKNAMLAIDNVRLLRDTPYGDQDNLVPAPVVVTDTRFARGATMAFGRIKTVTGESVSERGFCWAETPDPTINDNSTTDFLSNNGNIYWMKNLKPGTMYYMRAFAKNSYGKVGYGEVIKFSTIPMGTINATVRDGGDQATYNRIKNATETAAYYWNNLTEMKDFNPSVGFVDGTPTADCSYGGWVRVGNNTSYQRAGTIMHEWLHGVGVIPWADTEWSRHNLRSGVNGDGYGTGQWLGDRVTEVLRFWDNSTTEVLNGDYQHMWPYGINGASEDNGSDVLYLGNGLVCQALGEDGLQHTYSTFAEPYYALTQEDNIKYYIKNEDENRGLYTSYLIPNASGTLKWRAMSAAEAQANDSTAWYVTFTPKNQYYQFRNAATGQYLTFLGSMKTVARTSLTDNENFHLMKGRVVVGSGKDAKRGYWIIHPTDNWTPPCLQANTNGNVGSSTFNIANSATTQRWLILTAEEASQMEQASIATLKTHFNTILAEIKKLVEVPHAEKACDADENFAEAIADIERRAEEVSSVTDVTQLESDATAAAFAFLCNVYATDSSKPFDLTYMIQNAGMDATDGWLGSPTPSLSYSCAEYYQIAFNFYQNIANLPAGNYQVLAQGFQRPGNAEDTYNDYTAGNNNVTAYLYAGNTSNAIQLAHIASEARRSKIGVGSESTVGNNLYVPATMQAASAYFANGLYENKIDATVDANGNSLRIGVRSTSMPSSYWAIFDNFRLHFFGLAAVKGDVNNDSKVDVADIASILSVMAGTATNISQETADVNGDGHVDVADIASVLTIMAEL